MADVQIAALYVQRGGCYWDLPGVDPWDEKRDARKYDGPYPVVAHPPCARWCALAKFVQSQHPHLRVGEDGGVFASALRSVRKWGGVLEHPAFSMAFSAHGIPSPVMGVRGWQRIITGEWVTAVAQRNYGHPALKWTWLLLSGGQPPALRWETPPEPVAVVSSAYYRSNGKWVRRKHNGRKELSRRQSSATPLEFRDALIAMARSCREAP